VILSPLFNWLGRWLGRQFPDETIAADYHA
jgi:hypothetical protein